MSPHRVCGRPKGACLDPPVLPSTACVLLGLLGLLVKDVRQHLLSRGVPGRKLMVDDICGKVLADLLRDR